MGRGAPQPRGREGVKRGGSASGCWGPGVRRSPGAQARQARRERWLLGLLRSWLWSAGGSRLHLAFRDGRWTTDSVCVYWSVLATVQRKLVKFSGKNTSPFVGLTSEGGGQAGKGEEGRRLVRGLWTVPLATACSMLSPLDPVPLLLKYEPFQRFCLRLQFFLLLPKASLCLFPLERGLGRVRKGKLSTGLLPQCLRVLSPWWPGADAGPCRGSPVTSSAPGLPSRRPGSRRRFLRCKMRDQAAAVAFKNPES